MILEDSPRSLEPNSTFAMLTCNKGAVASADRAGSHSPRVEAALSLAFLLCRHATAPAEVAVAGDGPRQAANVILKSTILALQLSMVFFDDINLL